MFFLSFLFIAGARLQISQKRNNSSKIALQVLDCKYRKNAITLQKNGATLFASGNGAEHYSVGLFAIGPFSNGDSVFFDIFN